MIVIPECFCRGSRFAYCYNLDSGLEPAGMTAFPTFQKPLM